MPVIFGSPDKVQEAEERTESTLADVLTELREVKTRLDSIERQHDGQSIN